ncbi:MAG TPA: sigma-54-dependent Fis family transcriptional regulator [Polyangiaceae bacterium]|nr:sigma-54-dependent Fis family transcriptional regulator [Polyangiaceae bacterium]
MMARGMADQALRRVERERDLYKGLLRLNSRSELTHFLEEALRLVVNVVEAEQGYLELFETQDSTDDQTWWTAAGCSDEEVGEIRTLVSRGIIAEALGTGEVIVTPSALLDPRFRDRTSVQRSNIHAVLCAPVGEDPPLGVLYLQRRSLQHMFSEEDRGCAEIFVEQLAPLAHALFERRRFEGSRDPTTPFRKRLKCDPLVGSSPSLAALLREVELVAPLDVCVLITGDTGVGKSQVARVIHANSARAAGPFVEINCAALPETLLEAELFGALPGAHSTATRKLDGKVTAARGGTLLLDEIGEMTTTAQAKLLQLLQTREYYPLGSSQPVTADVRIVAATNVDLRKAVAAKRFREDLLYRLQVLPIRVPSLAERRVDIPMLARYFCESAQRMHKLRTIELSPGALRALSVADWPGNIRELSHRVEAAAIRANADGAAQIEAVHLGLAAPPVPANNFEGCTFHEGTRIYQRGLLRATLDATGGNVSEAARRLDLTRAHVYTLMKTLGLERE